MNFKQIVKQTEQRQKAVKAVEKTVTREKKKVLLAFAKPILQYLLYIHNNKDYMFCSEAHVSPKSKRQRLFGDFFPPKTWKDAISENCSTETIIRVVPMPELSFFINSPTITFRIGGDYIPIVRYSYGGAIGREKELDFTDPEEFIKSFTELLIKTRQ